MFIKSFRRYQVTTRVIASRVLSHVPVVRLLPLISARFSTSSQYPGHDQPRAREKWPGHSLILLSFDNFSEEDCRDQISDGLTLSKGATFPRVNLRCTALQSIYLATDSSITKLGSENLNSKKRRLGGRTNHSSTLRSDSSLHPSSCLATLPFCCALRDRRRPRHRGLNPRWR